MAQRPVEFGITGFGYAFGEERSVAEAAPAYVPDPERIIRWGYQTFHQAPDGVTASQLAAQAAQDALGKLGMTPDDVDLVVVAASEMPEYLYWDTSGAVARELKIERRQTLLLNEGCACGVTGLGYVAGLMAIQPEIETVLFTAVNRVSEFHRNRMTVNNAVHSDGAVAAVLRKGHERNRWLATDQFTDPDLCDWFRTDYGGMVSPVPPPGWSALTADPGHVRVQEHFDRDPQRLREFAESLNARLVDVMEGACRRAGISCDDIAHVIYINDSPETCEEVGALVGVPPHRTNAQLSVGHGHIGAADQLVCLGEHLERGDMSEGDVVALTGISVGMRWYCTLIQI